LLSETVCFDRWKTRLPLGHCLAASWQRRCQRWLANSRIDGEALYGPLVLWAIQHWQNPGHTLHLALDTTMLWNRFCVVVVSVVAHGRAIPPLWQTLEHPSASVSASVSIALLEKADQLLVRFGAITLLADRAFPSDELITWFRGRPRWSYVMRLRGDTEIHGTAAPLGCQVRRLHLRRGQCRGFRGVRLWADGSQSVNLVIAHPTGLPVEEPWLLADTPVVLLNGPRQAGKSTLAGTFGDRGFKMLSLDDAATLASAREDPTGLVRSLDRAVIDEVQRAPELLLAIKQSVDNDRRPGRFLLTGSADLRLLPSVADSLAGRMEVLTLLPLAGCELEDAAGHWLECVFSGDIPRLASGYQTLETGAALVARVLCGGYPEAIARSTVRRREAWLRQYAAALLSRDVRHIASIEKLEQMPRLLRALAQMAGQLTNLNQLAGQLLLDHKTAAKYVGVLEQLFLIRRIQPWGSNRLSRIVKSPKLHFLDSGLLSHLRGADAEALQRDRTAFGSLLECYVVSELLKLASWSERDLQVLSYRDKDQRVVDVVIESGAGQLIGVEIKAKGSVHPRDFAGLRKLAELSGEQFIAGFVLYDGNETLPMGPGLWAVPLATLWCL